MYIVVEHTITNQESCGIGGKHFEPAWHAPAQLFRISKTHPKPRIRDAVKEIPR